MEYEVYEDEDIKVGDIISLKEGKAILPYKQSKFNKYSVIGVCTEVNNNIIKVVNKGIVDVNVTRNSMYRR